MSKCDNCLCNPVCDHNRFGFENCGNFKSKSLFVELPRRCKDCKHSKQPYIEYDEVFECHADTHYTGIRLVEADDFCKYAEMKEMECEG